MRAFQITIRLNSCRIFFCSGYRGAAARADQLLDEMEAKYLAGDMDLKPNTFT
jgi:hypothetical protein